MVLPAGDYTVDTYEELVQGLSFPVYRRVSTQLHMRNIPGHPGRSQTLEIDPQELEDAMAHKNALPTVAEETSSPTNKKTPTKKAALGPNPSS